jgi:acyl-CoA thioesterase FadM
VISVRNASISFGNVITLDDHVLATVRRAFVRKTRQEGKLAPFSDAERYRLEKECSLDAADLIHDDNQHPLPLMQKIGTLLPRNFVKKHKPILAVRVGPQHTNFGNRHADPAFLVETAVQALLLAKVMPIASVAIHYISEAKLGHKLECLLHDDRVFVVRTLMGGKQVLVCVARAAKLKTPKEKDNKKVIKGLGKAHNLVSRVCLS